MESPTRESRRLGFTETFLHRFYTDLGAGLVTVVMARLNGNLPKEDLEQAIATASHRHPILRCDIEEVPNGYQFHEREEVNLPAVVESENSASTLFEELISGPFAGNAPFWQLATCQKPQPHLFLKIHHALADGSAARSLLLEVLRIALGESSPNDILPLRPPVEDLMARSRKTYSAPLPIPESNTNWSFFQQAPLSDRSCRSLTLEIDAQPILDTAHRRGVTVNSLLMESILKSAKQLPGFPDSASLILPVSVRKRLNPPIGEEEMGCLIGNALVYAPNNSDKGTTDLATILGQQLEKAVAASITGPIQFSPEMVEGAIAPFQSEDQKEFGIPLALSNLGVAENVPTCVEALWFGASIRPGHIGILISASTIHQKLCLGFHFAEPLIDAKEVKKFAQSILAEHR